MRLVVGAAVVGGFIVVIPMVAQGATFTQPAGLAAGSGYRLVFESAGGTLATSSNVSSYNAFAQAQAGLNALLPTATWTAIISTATVSAVSNVDCPGCDNVPVFLVDGTEVAASTTNLFNNTFLHGILEDQSGSQLNSYAFTGSASNGTAKPGNTAGSSFVEVGYSFTSGTLFDFSSGYPATTSLSVYALSGELFTPGVAVPEPASGALLAAGGAIVALLRRRKRSATTPVS